jgi:hypothetical protein
VIILREGEVVKMTLEELKKKIDQFLQLNEELQEIGMYDVTHDGEERGFLQADRRQLVELSKKYNTPLETGRSQCEQYPREISIPELKMYAVLTDEEMIELVEVLACTRTDTEQATKSKN